MDQHVRPRTLLIAATAVAAVVASWAILRPGGTGQDGPETARRSELQTIEVLSPFDGVVFPPDMAAPTFRWHDPAKGVGAWLVSLAASDEELCPLARLTAPQWTPDEAVWQSIKQGSSGVMATILVRGVTDGSGDATPLSEGTVTISTSEDPVGAPIFYREVNLPFIDAVKDPSTIRWRFGPVSATEQPPVVLEGLPVCGNCHSFSADGKTLTMDVDYANSKGSYVITQVAREMTLATSDIITWNDYRREDGEQTFGLLSQVSPDGRYVISTVKDKSVFVPRPDLAFSQLFFPIKGILAVYDRAKRTFAALPGADDPNFVQSNPSWSPDGKHVVFARAKAYDLGQVIAKDKVLLTPDECREFLRDGKTFHFSLYRLPFNEGRGGEAEPIEGASNNGKSNFFAKYSPDGKWIVFCQANDYMLLQPDSELYIIPAEGGEARRLACNTKRMNSWHSWSPNSRWLVFSSKANGPYTQLFLTHMDEQGRSTPPVLLERFTAPDRAANIPEFVNVAPDAIARIDEQFINDYSHVRAGDQFFLGADADNAIREYRNALRLNPNNSRAHLRLGFLLFHVKKDRPRGLQHTETANRLQPSDGRPHYDLGMAYLWHRDLERAVHHLSEALRLLPEGLDKQYNLPDMHTNLGRALVLSKRPADAEGHFAAAIKVKPAHLPAQKALADAQARQGRFDEAVRSATQALTLARAEGNAALVQELTQRLAAYREGKP